MSAYQPPLWGGSTVRELVAPEPTANVADSFREFLRLNPWIIEWFERKALDLVRRGHQRIGINMLCEVFRYEQMRSTVDPSGNYKINNNYAPYLSRELAQRQPELADAFEFRSSRADAVHDFSGSNPDTLFTIDRSIAASAYDW